MEKRAEPFTKSMLPQSRPPWRSVVTSLALQVLAVFAILTLSYSVVKSADIETRSYTLTYLKTEIAPLKRIHLSAGKAAPAPRTPVGDIQLPEEPRRPAFQPVLAAPVISKSVQPKPVPVPEIEKENPLLPVPTGELAVDKGPRKPREEVRTGTFGNEGEALVAGFGGKGRSEVAPSGLGVGSGGTGPGSGKRGTVKEASFDQTAAPFPVRRTENQSPTPAIQPVQITFKPKPIYTEEARKKQVQGDVVLEVVFQASGEVIVNRIVSGLGYGLDEAAEQAARLIKFTPAHEDGKPIDLPARIHILFQLAS